MWCASAMKEWFHYTLRRSNDPTVKCEQKFKSLPCLILLTNFRNSYDLRMLFKSLAWTALETLSWLNIFCCKYIKLPPNFYGISVVTTVIRHFIQQWSKCKWRVVNYMQTRGQLQFTTESRQGSRKKGGDATIREFRAVSKFSDFCSSNYPWEPN